MNDEQSLAKLRPLLFGRITRMIFGIITLSLIPFVAPGRFEVISIVGLLFLGISFLVGGLISNPGCEITALFNLFLPSRKRKHFI
ncbi:MAG: hypothetical protein V3U73_15740 [bacterium]